MQSIQKSSLFFSILFLTSLAYIAFTRSPFLIIWWVSFWFFASHFTKGTLRLNYLIFMACLIFLFPRQSSNYLQIHKQEFIILSFILIFFFMNHGVLRFVTKINLRAQRLIIFWLIWCSIAYLPLAVVWLLDHYDIVSGLFGLPIIAHIDYLTYILTICSALIALVAIYSIRNLNDCLKFRQFLYLISALLAVGGLVQYFLGYYPIEDQMVEYFLIRDKRLFSFNAINPNNYGRYMIAPTLFLFTDVVIKDKSKVFKRLILFGMILLTIVLTFSRTSYVSISFGLIICTLLFLNSNKAGTFLRTLFVLGSVVFFINSLDMQSLTRERDRFTSMDNLTVSRAGRYIAAIKVLKAKPFFGAHPGNYVEDMVTIGQYNQIRGRYIGSAHNMFFGIAVDFGLPLGIAFLLMPISSIIGLLRIYSKVKRMPQNDELQQIYKFSIAGIGLFSAYLVHGLTEIVPTTYMFLFFGIFVAFRYHAGLILNKYRVSLSP